MFERERRGGFIPGLIKNGPAFARDVAFMIYHSATGCPKSQLAIMPADACSNPPRGKCCYTLVCRQCLKSTHEHGCEHCWTYLVGGSNGWSKRCRSCGVLQEADDREHDFRRQLSHDPYLRRVYQLRKDRELEEVLNTCSDRPSGNSTSS